MIFSHVLYQLSYLGAEPVAMTDTERRVYNDKNKGCPVRPLAQNALELRTAIIGHRTIRKRRVNLGHPSDLALRLTVILS